MTREELLETLDQIQQSKCETRTLEIKRAKEGCPKRLYDTLSSFSNQNDGGVILFGVDEENGFEECGVYDPQDLQKKVAEQCLQMEPRVRPVMTVAEKGGKTFVSAEIPGLDLSDRPCYYRGGGILKGSYIRVGDSDEPMTEYEVYSYEAFRKKYQDDIRIVPRATFSMIDRDKVAFYVLKLKNEKPNLKLFPDETVYELMSITRNGEWTLSSVLLFCQYPQAFFPQLCITAVCIPGDEIGEVGEYGERFTDNMRIEGTIPEMLEGALSFIRKNMKTKTIVDPNSGKREDRTDYPMTAIREAVLNSLVHRDYSIHTEGMPIQIRMFPDRIEIHNPGGIYGRLTVDQLGKMQPDTRNPVLVTAMEVLGLTENRYSGIPTIRRRMEEYGLPEPVFKAERGSFVVILYKNRTNEEGAAPGHPVKEEDLLSFLETPRSRKEIADYMKVASPSYAVWYHVNPLIEKGLVEMTIPDKPKSRNQRFVRRK